MPTYACERCHLSFYVRTGRAKYCPECRRWESNRYNYAHQQVRAEWKPRVESGGEYCRATECLMPNRWIHPAAEWHLGHDETGTRHIGPVHARCNVVEGAIRGAAKRWGPRRAERPAEFPRSRDWGKPAPEPQPPPEPDPPAEPEPPPEPAPAPEPFFI